MKKTTAKKSTSLRREYDLAKLRGGVRGKYHRRYTEGTNLVLLEPEIAEAFPDAKAVNDALRVLVKVASNRVRTNRKKKRA